jgi:hypothetical protein
MPRLVAKHPPGVPVELFATCAVRFRTDRRDAGLLAGPVRQRRRPTPDLSFTAAGVVAGRNAHLRDRVADLVRRAQPATVASTARTLRSPLPPPTKSTTPSGRSDNSFASPARDSDGQVRLLAESPPVCKHELCRFGGKAVVMSRAAASDDLQELARRGRWLLQTAVGEVTRRDKSRSPVAGRSAPGIRQTRASRHRRPCGSSGVTARAPAFPRLRESPGCLLAARSAITTLARGLSAGLLLA